MVKVVAVADARTLIIESNGQQESIRLSGIAITDEMRAAELLRWTAGGAYVFLEKRADGGHFVWRSPDALFLNREVVLRGFARATQAGVEAESNLRVTYLGIVDPPGPQRVTAAAKTDSTARPRSTGSKSQRSRSSRRAPAPDKTATPRTQ